LPGGAFKIESHRSADNRATGGGKGEAIPWAETTAALATNKYPVGSGRSKIGKGDNILRGSLIDPGADGKTEHSIFNLHGTRTTGTPININRRGGDIAGREIGWSRALGL